MASHPIYQFYVELADYKPKIWRKFQVMNNITMAKLGYIIMSMFEMKGNHLFEFDIPLIDNFKNSVDGHAESDYNKEIIDTLTQQGFKGVKIPILQDDEFASNEYHYYEPSIKLHKVFFKPGDTATLAYDFGDGWEFNIVYGGSITSETLLGKDLPRVLEGEGFGIIEDCGGTGGLKEIEKAFKKKSGSNYKEYCEWLDITELDLSSFDIDEMNYRIKKLPRIFADIYEKGLEPTAQSVCLLERKSKQRLSAADKWDKISSEHQQMLINNAFCHNCGLTEIVEYKLKNDKHGISLEGKCAKCSKQVARYVEDEQLCI